jgi:hypothetical protein
MERGLVGIDRDNHAVAPDCLYQAGSQCSSDAQLSQKPR